ncbi:hypothetical protein diail_2818, partial [Diaporthe ilicicola]
LLSVLYLQQHGPTPIDNEKLGHAPEHIEDGSASDRRPASILSRRPSSLSSSSHYNPSRSPSPGSIRSAAPSYHSRAPHRQSEWVQVSLEDNTPNNSSTGSSSRAQSVATSAQGSRCSSWDVTTLASNSDADSIRSGISLPDTDSVVSGGSLPPAPLPGSSTEAPRRWSTSTSSSFNANAFIVTDGFRPGDHQNHPPEYSSRPGSLYHETVKYDAGLGLPNGPVP